MKKGIQAYARISDVIALELCIHAGIFFLLHSNNEEVGGDGFFSFPIVIAFVFTLYNGILMTIAGIYLVLKGARQLGWTTIVVVLIFYFTALLIHFYERPAAVRSTLTWMPAV
jgi:hypothetical protein